VFPHFKRQRGWQFHCSIVSYRFWIKNKLASFKEDNSWNPVRQQWIMCDCLGSLPGHGDSHLQPARAWSSSGPGTDGPPGVRFPGPGSGILEGDNSPGNHSTLSWMPLCQ
jgi:hypothetical protein